MHATTDPTGALTTLRFHTPKHPAPNHPHTPHPALQNHLNAYFAKKHPATPLPIHLNPHGTPFQKTIWAQLQKIPRGTTTTYSAIANQHPRKTSPRATAQAIARNPIHILIPCHRVIGANGTLTGYAAGLDKKTALLQLEQ
jgi:methylated-DNA-[protein]-cysteine S-methyltransferase